MDSLVHLGLFQRWFLVLTGISLRYILFAVLAYFIFYAWKKHNFSLYKIQSGYPKLKVVFTEFKYSISTIFIFSLVIWLTIWAGRKGYTQMYYEMDTYPIWYFLLSIALIILLHDTYFYWTHRLMHWKRIFPYIHHIHHLSHNPTPLAAFSFHPLEAVVEIGVLPLAIFIIPLHPVALFVFGNYMIFFNVIGHLGYEFFPKNFLQNKWLKWHNTSTHHNMHHHYSKGNFSLYFNVWDGLMGTNHQRYEQEFIQIKKLQSA